MRIRFRRLTIILGLLSAASAAYAAGDAVAGKVAFDNQCAVCHGAHSSFVPASA
jgi:mono/diheme cytochrome c family protein